MYLVDKYKAHMDKIAADGLLLREGYSESLIGGFVTAAQAKELETMDAVILMVKCTQTEDVMPDVLHCVES